MGGICNQVQNKTFGSLQEAPNNATKSHYDLAYIQDNAYLQDRVNKLIQSHQDFRHYQSGKLLYKHKTKNLYYFGDWDLSDYQKGKGIQYKQDEYFYYGDFDTVPHGEGVYESITNRYIYEGHLDHGRIEGQGKVYSLDNLFSFEGVFNKHSQPITGNLIINHPNDETKACTVYLNNYPENKARISYNQGKQYQGQISFSTFVPHGHGVARYPNNYQYGGNWDHGQFHGHGKFSWDDGSSYEGAYVHGKKQGYGVFTYSSGKVYKGNWLNGKQEGEGTLYSKHGQTLKEGMWKDGAFSHQVTLQQREKQLLPRIQQLQNLLSKPINEIGHHQVGKVEQPKLEGGHQQVGKVQQHKLEGGHRSGDHEFPASNHKQVPQPAQHQVPQSAQHQVPQSGSHQAHQSGGHEFGK